MCDRAEGPDAAIRRGCLMGDQYQPEEAQKHQLAMSGNAGLHNTHVRRRRRDVCKIVF